MSSQDDKDQDIRVVAVVLISAIVLAVGLALGIGVHKARSGAGADGAGSSAALSASASASGDAAAGAGAGAGAAAGAAGAAGGVAADGASGGAATASASGDAASAAGAQAAAAAADDASIVVENGVVKFYFAVGKADLAPGAVEALTDAIDAAKAGRKLVLSGYHDATGNAASNAELAKQRAIAVRDALVGAGVDAGVIELKKPEETTGTGNAAEARRVEVLIVD